MADQSFHQEPPLDIVDRLRCMSFVVCVEAAVEIERLRTAITDAAEAVECGHERVKVASILRAAYTKMGER